MIKGHENEVDYSIKVRNKVKLYHINMLKKFFRRDSMILKSKYVGFVV